MGEVEVQALRGVSLELRESEFLVLLGPLRQRQVHAAEHPRRPRRAHLRHGDLSRPEPHHCRGAGAHLVPPQARRLRVPVLQPDPQPDGARERRAGHRHRRRTDGPGRGAEAGESVGPPRSLSLAALGRRAAAGRDRAGGRQAPRRAALRRADRRARHRHRHPRARSDPAGERGARHHDRGHHPQRRGRRHGRPRRLALGRPRGQRSPQRPKVKASELSW